MYQNYLKRLLAIVLSALGIVTLSWLFLLLCIAIKLDSPVPCSSSRSVWVRTRAILTF